MPKRMPGEMVRTQGVAAFPVDFLRDERAGRTLVFRGSVTMHERLVATGFEKVKVEAAGEADITSDLLFLHGKLK